ncbi:hypothetical protein MN116_008571 [Schistosoma mekongi]|uniref:Tyrosine-protein phosphatase non-receptor type 9 n=1 Tax=Schistosoma mekongi TaxID=38744 RepID=A0AAE1Z5B7_SCHME|nr:hypothetical protein MN116_008571 [Schistosoma mekongi]
MNEVEWVEKCQNHSKIKEAYLLEIQAFITKVKSLPGGTSIQQDEAEKAAHLYLRARKRDVERAIELYKANKRMRYTENVDSIDPLEDGVRRELLSGKFTVLPTLPDDEMDATIAIFTAYRHWPPLTTHRDTLKGVLYQLDAAMLDEQSQRKGLVVLYDMRDTKYSNFDYHLCIKLLNLFKGVYPARLRKVIIIEPPLWFRAPFNVLRLFVREKMRDRIYSVGYDELSVHLPNSTLKRLFGQLTQNQHFDWLLNCLKRTGHASRMPSDYFTLPSLRPPLTSAGSIYSTLYNPLLGNELVVQLHLYNNNNVDGNDHNANKTITLPRYNTNTTISNSKGITLSSIHGSLRVPMKNRRCSDDAFNSIIITTPSSSSSITGSTQLQQQYTVNGSISPPHPQIESTIGLQTSPLPRRGLLANNRMTDSMFEASGISTGFHDERHALFRSSDRHFSHSSSFRCRANNTTNSSRRTTNSSYTSSYDRLYVTNQMSETRLSISEFITRVQSIGSIGLTVEFEALFKDSPVKGACTRFAQASNRHRNRYLDVPCLDSTAVELSDNTYIHANWVDGYQCPRAYILAQGPLENTIREFWMTVWEHKVITIIMLTKVVEGQRPKCALYWPTKNPSSKDQSLRSSSSTNSSLLNITTNGVLHKNTQNSNNSVLSTSITPISATYGEFHVTNCGEFIEAGGLYKRSVLEVTCKSPTINLDTTHIGISRMECSRQKSKPSNIHNSLKNTPTNTTNISNNKLTVHHYLYLGWPDFDVPVDSEEFLKFLLTVKQSHKSRSRLLLSPSISSLSTSPSATISSTDHTVSQSSSISSPLLVHCSAGIGRTGTFVTTDICLQQALNEGYLDVPDVINQLRCQRAGAVQVAKQYAFIHQALVSQLSKQSSQLQNNNEDSDKCNDIIGGNYNDTTTVL